MTDMWARPWLQDKSVKHAAVIHCCSVLHLLDSVRLQESSTAAEAVALGAILLAVAQLAVDVLVRAVAGVRRVQDARALLAVKARLVVVL